MNCENCGLGIRPPNEPPTSTGDFRPRGHRKVEGHCFACGEASLNRSVLTRIAVALEKIT